LPGVSQQNAFLGLPMTLMREETAYLVSTGIAHLVPLSRPSLPSDEDVARHTAARVARIRAMEERRRLASEQKAAEGEVAFERGGDKARAKREARAKAKAEKLAAQLARAEGIAKGGEEDGSLFEQAAAEDSDRKAAEAVTTARGDQPKDSAVPVSTATTAASTTTAGAASTSTSTPEAGSHGYFLTVPATPHFPALSQGETITSIPHRLFPFPTLARDRGLIGTFKSLASQGYRVGLGPRFGGEYLVYPGDYLRYHAHFTSQVLVRDEPLKPTEIVAWGRLGTGTKKAGLICCWDDGVRGDAAVDEGFVEGAEQKGEVEFYSLEWANFG